MRCPMVREKVAGEVVVARARCRERKFELGSMLAK